VTFEEADRLNRAIRLVAIKHRSLAGSALARLGLHHGQEVLLLELAAHGGRTQVQLAAGLGCEAPSVTLMAQKLEAGDLITRHPSSADARATLVQLTERGHEVVRELRSVWQGLAETTIAGLQSTSLEDLLEAVTDLAQSLYSDKPPNGIHALGIAQK